MLKPIDRTVLSNLVFEQLRDEILKRGYRPGEKLPPERELCEILGVNRSSVREALKRLEQARLIETRQGGGSTVLDFSLNAGFDLLPWLVMPGGKLDGTVIRSLMEFKLLMNPATARYAALRIDDAGLAELEGIVEEIDECVDDVDRFQELDFRFHYAMAQASENVAFMLVFNSIEEIYGKGRVLFTSIYRKTIADRSLYREVYDALASHDSTTAHEKCLELNKQGVEAFGGVGAV